MRRAFVHQGPKSQAKKNEKSYPYVRVRVRGVMVLDVGCEFHDRGSIPSECQIPRDVGKSTLP